MAADLLSQAEHDRLATAVLVCDSEALAEAVAGGAGAADPACCPGRTSPARPSTTTARSSLHGDLAEGVDIANEIAPEHLELCVDDPFACLDSSAQRGSASFWAETCPEALGDYFAGPNHTLPTLGTARFSSPLSVDDFVKKSSFIYYTKEALGAVQERIVDFAEREGLSAHARSVSIRFEDGQ